MLWNWPRLFDIEESSTMFQDEAQETETFDGVDWRE